MFAARRIPLTAFALVASLAAAGCGDGAKDTTTTVSGARTPAVNPDARGTPAAEPAGATYADGESAFRAGRFSEAVTVFEAYGSRHPGNAGALYMLGLSEWKAGNLKAADAAFDRALAIDSESVKTLLNSSRVLLELGRAEEALDRINTAIGLDSTSSEARRLQGRALERTGDIEGAIDAYHLALVADERDVWALNNLGLLYIQQGRAEDALGPLARAVELKPGAPAFQNNLGIALEQTGHFGAAVEAYSAALAADSTYQKAAVSLARVNDRIVGEEPAAVSLKELSQNFQMQIRMLKDSARVVEPDSAIVAAPTIDEPAH